jgi:hypothetical protein
MCSKAANLHGTYGKEQLKLKPHLAARGWETIIKHWIKKSH